MIHAVDKCLNGPMSIDKEVDDGVVERVEQVTHEWQSRAELRTAALRERNAQSPGRLGFFERGNSDSDVSF